VLISQPFERWRYTVCTTLLSCGKKRPIGLSPPPHQRKEKEEMGKQCSNCGEVKPLELFSKNRTRTDGHSHACKDCERVRLRKYDARKARYKRFMRYLKLKNEFEPTTLEKGDKYE
jgi:hypothetical protein